MLVHTQNSSAYNISHLAVLPSRPPPAALRRCLFRPVHHMIFNSLGFTCAYFVTPFVVVSNQCMPANIRSENELGCCCCLVFGLLLYTTVVFSVIVRMFVVCVCLCVCVMRANGPEGSAEAALVEFVPSKVFAMRPTDNRKQQAINRAARHAGAFWGRESDPQTFVAVFHTDKTHRPENQTNSELNAKHVNTSGS